jgi:hypothetical protein
MISKRHRHAAIQVDQARNLVRCNFPRIEDARLLPIVLVAEDPARKLS